MLFEVSKSHTSGDLLLQSNLTSGVAGTVLLHVAGIASQQSCWKLFVTALVSTLEYVVPAEHMEPATTLSPQFILCSAIQQVIGAVVAVSVVGVACMPCNL